MDERTRAEAVAAATAKNCSLPSLPAMAGECFRRLEKRAQNWLVG
jgi:hypothetical protein